MKIGIMGGTFNPIHNAHLMMAQAAYEQYKLDEIWFMPSAKPPHKNQDEITEKERAVMKLVADGKSNKEIAGEMFLSEGTIRNYISGILDKLNLRDRTQLAVFYLRNCT